MGNYFTRKNMKNWKWWVAMALMLITVTLMAPIVIFVIVIDVLDVVIGYLDNLITCIIDKFEDVMSEMWVKVGKWVKS